MDEIEDRLVGSSTALAGLGDSPIDIASIFLCRSMPIDIGSVDREPGHDIVERLTQPDQRVVPGEPAFFG